MTKRLDPDRPNKARRGRPPKRRTNGNALAKIWSTPEGRARMIAAQKAGSVEHRKERALNPDKFSRAGVPHGHTRASVAPLIAKAREHADRLIQMLKDEGKLPEVVIPNSKEAKGEAVLHEAAVIALSPGDRQARMAAIRTVLEYTMAKPASKSTVTVNTSEDWLAEIAADAAAGR